MSHRFPVTIDCFWLSASNELVVLPSNWQEGICLLANEMWDLNQLDHVHLVSVGYWALGHYNP